jgi:hypothetical protein
MSIKRFKQIPEPAVAGDAFWDNRFHNAESQIMPPER